METPDEMRTKIVDKATGDAEFRARLLGDPKGALERELGVAIPASLSIEVHEESAGDRASGSSPQQQAERKRPARGRRRQVDIAGDKQGDCQLVIPPRRANQG